ncbi:MAG TPA: DUF2617 family protein [Phycisphaerae bacterium]|jgi:hypothetical protein|nr:DUF2617 family protein [Phycisphaerae bacterium]
MSTMSVHHKKPRSAGLSVLVYDRGLHPELFTVDARRGRVLGGLDVSMWLIAGGGHLVSVSAGGKTVSEVACFPSKALPDRGLVERLPCKGDKQYEKTFGNHFQYYLALNEEHVSEALFENSVTELLRLAEDQGGLVSHKKNDLGQTEYLSIVVAQLHRRAVHIEGFHLLGDARVLVRTQSIIEPVAKN